MSNIIYHDYKYPDPNEEIVRPFFRFLEDYYKDISIVGAEIGIFQGGGPLITLKYGKLNLTRYYLIDPYIEYHEFRQAILDDAFIMACTVLRGYGSIVRSIWMKSHDAAGTLEELDFVYIDGDHVRDRVYDDLNTYYDILKPGGVIGGHDLSLSGSRFPDILVAVGDFIDKYNLELHVNEPDYWVIKEGGK